MWFVYILLCENGSLYTGFSDDPERRFTDHENGKGGKYTRSFKPVKIIHLEKYNTKQEALKRECKIKGWSREEKIRILQLRF
jgi:putative endonuclease